MKKRTVLLVMAVLFWFLGAMKQLDTQRSYLGKLRLEETLRQTAVACYAAEGAYPPDISYMEEQYHLRFDKERYIVRYEIFASNLMPEITVLEAVP